MTSIGSLRFSGTPTALGRSKAGGGGEGPECADLVVCRWRRGAPGLVIRMIIKRVEGGQDARVCLVTNYTDTTARKMAQMSLIETEIDARLQMLFKMSNVLQANRCDFPKATLLSLVFPKWPLQTFENT